MTSESTAARLRATARDYGVASPHLGAFLERAASELEETQTDLATVTVERDRLVKRVEVIAGIHPELAFGACGECGEPWPCRTYQATSPGFVLP